MVPIAFHYQPNDQPRWGERMVGVLASAAVVTAGVLSLGHPVLGRVVGTAGGALAGLLAGGTLGRRLVDNPDATNPFPKFGAGVIGAAVGTLVGAAAGFAASANPASVLCCSVAGGAATLGLAEAWRTREVCRVRIGVPIDLAPYHAWSATDRKAAVHSLTEELHERVGRLKADMSGVLYDATAPRVTEARPTRHFTPGVTLEEMRDWKKT